MIYIKKIIFNCTAFALVFVFLVIIHRDTEPDFCDYLTEEINEPKQDFSEFSISEPLINSLDCGSIEWFFISADKYGIRTKKVNNTDSEAGYALYFTLEFFDGSDWRVVPPHPFDRGFFPAVSAIVEAKNVNDSLHEFHSIPAVDLFRLRRTFYIRDVLYYSTHELVVEFSFDNSRSS